jgi:SH3 domain protein
MTFMRRASPAIFAALLLISTVIRAELNILPASPEVITLQAQLDQLEQRLAESERLRSELNSQPAAALIEQDSPQLSRLKQDNQRLKLQLKTLQAQQPGPLLSEKQLWFAVGGSLALLSFILGFVARSSRKKHRDWIS